MLHCEDNFLNTIHRLGNELTKKTPGNQNLEQGLPVAPVVELVTSYIQELGQRL